MKSWLLPGVISSGKSSLSDGDSLLRDYLQSLRLLTRCPVDGEQRCQVGQIDVAVAVEVAVLVSYAASRAIIGQ